MSETEYDVGREDGYLAGLEAAYSAIELRWQKEPNAASDWLLVALAEIDRLRGDTVFRIAHDSSDIGTKVTPQPSISDEPVQGYVIPFAYSGERTIGIVTQHDTGFGFTVFDPEDNEASSGCGPLLGVVDMLVEGLEAYYLPVNADIPVDDGERRQYDGQWHRDLYGSDDA